MLYNKQTKLDSNPVVVDLLFWLLFFSYNNSKLLFFVSSIFTSTVGTIYSYVDDAFYIYLMIQLTHLRLTLYMQDVGLIFSTLLVRLFVLHPHSRVLRTQKLRFPLVRTQSLKVLPLKPAVGQYIAMHATLTARGFSLLISTLPVRSPASFPKPLPSFSCVGCG